MRIANCKWFVGSRARWLHFKCCPTQLPSPYGSRVWQHGVSCLTFFSYMKNNFHLILLPAAENEWKKCFILKFVLVFFNFNAYAGAVARKWGRGRGNVCGSCVPWLSLSRCRFMGKERRGEEGEPFGPRRFRFLLLNVRTNFYEYCVCFVVVDVGWYNLPVSPPALLFVLLLLSLPFPFIQAFYDFLPFFLLSVVFCMRCVVENSENYAWLRSSPPRPQRDWAPFVCCLLLWSASATPLCPTAPLSLGLFLALLCKSFSFVQSKISKPLCLCVSCTL